MQRKGLPPPDRRNSVKRAWLLSTQHEKLDPLKLIATLNQLRFNDVLFQGFYVWMNETYADWSNVTNDFARFYRVSNTIVTISY